MSERELIIQLKQGSYQAFDKLYAQYSPHLFSFCFSYTKSKSDASSIVQDTFIRLWKIRGAIRDVDSLRPLLFTIAKSYLINAYNKRVNSDLYADFVCYSNTPDLTFADSNLSYCEFVEMIKCMLKKYPATQQRVIILSKLHGLSIKEISACLNLSNQTVKNQLSLGMKRLKQELIPLKDTVLTATIILLLS